MGHGLAWSAFLLVFCWLAWLGWNEYRKIEAYKVWAGDFDQAKYDITAVLGEKAGQITWGKPSRKGPYDLKTANLASVSTINLQVDGQPVELTANGTEDLRGKKILLVLQTPDRAIEIPFTEIPLAVRWLEYLQKCRATVA
jgi:hypothetical protein